MKGSEAATEAVRNCLQEEPQIKDYKLLDTLKQKRERKRQPADPRDR